MANSFEFLDAPTEELAGNDSPLVDWPDNRVDPRVTRMSYSSGLLFQSCPRKFQLAKLSDKRAAPDTSSRITFGFGHLVGTGIQDLFEGKSLETTIWNAFLAWQEDLFAENDAQKKTFFHGVAALQSLHQALQEGLLDDWELAYFNGKPAVELSYRVHFPNGFTERGYVDVVLRHKRDGSYAILENKTSSSYSINASQYKNSSQAVGYSVVLNQIAPGITDYTVHYLVYQTRSMVWQHFEFPKTYTQRALWVRDKLWNFSLIHQLVQLEGNSGVWPQHGQSCTAWGRDCEYMGMCNMSTDRLVSPLRENQLEETATYDFEINWEDLNVTEPAAT